MIQKAENWLVTIKPSHVMNNPDFRRDFHPHTQVQLRPDSITTEEVYGNNLPLVLVEIETSQGKILPIDLSELILTKQQRKDLNRRNVLPRKYFKRLARVVGAKEDAIAYALIEEE